ncbi:MAG: YpdA family putative bacillithiol disulfide reductase [Gemmatimonadales bacterium]
MDETEHVPALIVGAGPIGLACAVSAQRRGIQALVIDTGAVVNSIVRYPIGMTFFTTPERLEIGNHPFTCSGSKATREEALKYYRGVARVERLRIRTYCRLVGAERRGNRIVCRVRDRFGNGAIQCDRLVLATGYFEHANLLNVPGEELPHVTHWFDEAHLTYGRDVVIVGGKNSAVEAALQCFRAGGRVTLVYRGGTLKPTVKFWLRPDIENRLKAGEIAARFGAMVTAISPAAVTIRRVQGEVEQLPADRVYSLTGYHPDYDLLAAVGVRCDPDSGRPTIDRQTLETDAPGVFLAGSVSAGRNISEVFIENGRFDGEKIFGDHASRERAEALYQGSTRPVGE